MTEAADRGHLRILVAAPTRRDGEVTFELLSRAGLDGVICTGLQGVADELAAGVGAIVLTDAVIGDSSLTRLVSAIQQQPPWSDVPVLMLTRDKAHSASAIQALETLGNVTLLDRPS